MQGDDDLRRENEALRQRIETLERLRAELLGTVGHELRAPLIAIKGSTTTVLGAAQAPARPAHSQSYATRSSTASRRPTTRNARSIWLM